MNSPYVSGAWYTNDKGQLIGGGNTLDSMSGISSLINQGQALGAGDLNNRVRMLMASGGAPSTPAEAAAMQSMYEKEAARNDQNSRQSGINMLLGGAGGTGGPGGSLGAAGSYSSGSPLDSGHNLVLQSGFINKLNTMLNNPGLDDATVQGMISKGNDQISESTAANQLALNEAAGAAGMGSSGAMLEGVRQLYTDAAGQKATNARDINTMAAQDRENRQQQAVATAGDYLGRLHSEQAAMARQQAEMANARQIAAANAMMSQRTSVPDYSSLIGMSGSRSGTSFGYGGGANRGRGPGAGAGGGFPDVQAVAGARAPQAQPYEHQGGADGYGGGDSGYGYGSGSGYRVSPNLDDWYTRQFPNAAKGKASMQAGNSDQNWSWLPEGGGDDMK